MLENAVAAGVSILTYWDLTIAEINIYIDVYKRKKEQRENWQARLCYTNAMLVGATTAYIMSNGKSKVPKIQEVFPTLIKQENKPQEDWQITKERMIRFANAHNKKRGENK